MKRRSDRTWVLAIAGIIAGFLLGLWVGYQFIPGLSNANVSELSAEQQDEFVTLVALSYAQTQNLEQTRNQLAELKAPNAGQFVASVTERRIGGGADAQIIAALAQLAVALGVNNPTLAAYLPTATPNHPTPTATTAPTATMEAWPTNTPQEPTPTAEPPTATAEADTPTPEPATATPELGPVVIADSAINVRGGPGTGFAVVGGLSGGEQAPILGRSDDGAWWQIELASGAEGWVLSQLVSTSGDTSGVAIAANIPTPPPAPTAASRPTAAPTNPPAPAAPGFRLVERRLWNVEETGARNDHGSIGCNNARHEAWVYVFDAAGAPLNGVTVGSPYQDGNKPLVTGEKGPGIAQFNLFGGGDDFHVVRDVDGRDATSDLGKAPGHPAAMSDQELISANYCANAAECAVFRNEGKCFSHYSWDIKFQRNY